MNMPRELPLSFAPAESSRAARARRSALWMVAVAALGLGAFIAWAGLFTLDELSRAQGQVIAAARTQVIQAADGGVLEDLRVQEGQHVKKGELLAQLERNRVEAAYADSRGKVAALKAASARLEAEVFGRRLDFPQEVKAYPAYVRNQTELYERRRRALQEAEGALQRNLRLVDQELALNEPLLAAGDIGETEVIRLRRQEVEIQGQLVNLRNKYFQDAQAEMTRVEEELNTQEQMLAERGAMLEHTELRAPVNGQVRNIAITTLGAAVRAGDIVMELLPTDSELIVEAKLRAADLAFVRKGLPAAVKLDAYDYSIYGQLEGKVSYVSPDALTERTPQGDMHYYRVHIKVETLPEPRAGRKIEVHPGMTAQIEIRTGERTVLAYLTKPVTKTIAQSMGER